jgi:ribosomal protein S6E (S10)
MGRNGGMEPARWSYISMLSNVRSCFAETERGERKKKAGRGREGKTQATRVLLALVLGWCSCCNNRTGEQCYD